MFESIAAFWAEYGNVLTDGVWDTLVMVVISTAFAYLIGLPLGVALILTQPHGIRPHRGVYRVLDWIVNIGRSVPFIILMVAIMPFTRMVVGTTIGVKGAIVPLVVSAAPFIARMVETSLAEVDAGVVEAAQSMGSRQLGNLRKGHAAGGAQFVTSHELRAPFIQMNNKASNAAVTDEHIGAFP